MPVSLNSILPFSFAVIISSDDSNTISFCPCFHVTSMTEFNALYSDSCDGVLENTSSWNP